MLTNCIVSMSPSLSSPYLFIHSFIPSYHQLLSSLLHSIQYNSGMESNQSIDPLMNLIPLEIPRPKCHGMQFVPTRGRYGFYRTIRAEGSKYGVSIKSLGPRRPVISKDLFSRPQTVIEEEEKQDNQGSTESINNSTVSSSSSQTSSDRSSPIEIEPDYPVDDNDLPQSINNRHSSQSRPVVSTKF